MKIIEIAGSGDVGTKQMGPVTNVIFQLASKFCELGHEVYVADAQNENDRVHLPPGISLIQTDTQSRARLVLPPATKRSLLGRIISFVGDTSKTWKNEAKFVREIEAQVDITSFDICHVHEWRPAYLLQKKYKNCIYTIHTPNKLFGEYLNSGALTKLYERLMRAIGFDEIEVIKKSLFSAALGTHIQRRLPDIHNIKLVPNGINLEEWVSVDRNSARKQLGYRESDFVILFAGSINRRKGVHLLLEAVRLLCSKYSNLKVVIIGSMGGTTSNPDQMTPYAQDILEKAKNLPVDMVGFVNNRSQEFRNYVGAADVFVLPALFDNQPTVILEALAMGTPVLASKVGGIPDMVSEKVGMTFDVGSSVDLAKKLSFLAENPEILMEMRSQCRSHVEKHYSWTEAAQNYLRAFSQSMPRQD